MTDKRTWNFCGRYGDEDETIYINKLPEELNKTLQKALVKLYEGNAEQFYDCGVSMDNGYKLETYGLARQVGNAWHHCILWAPQVHKWMKKRNKNNKIAAQLRAQYTI